jgi:penicillin-binding protein 1C
VGFSQRYTVGVWVGNASGAPMWDVSGTTGAAPIWAAIMNYLHKTQASHAPKPPTGVVQAAVRFVPATLSAASGPAPAGAPLQTVGLESGATAAIEAPRMEWFLQGTQQAGFALNTGADKPQGKTNPRAGQHASGRITAPANGSIIALDPDIPPKSQRLSFTANASVGRWLMDGKEFARGANAQWLPWPGRHVVQLVSASGEKLDEIRL